MVENIAISVIMSVYNGEKYLSEAIESVIAQTFKDFELIIINDCSTDSTAQILKSYEEKDPRIKVVTNEVNLKLPTSLNKAISLCRGKYIARMDSDDICVDVRLEKQFEFMESHPDISLSSCRFLTLKNDVYSSGGCGGRCDNDAIKAYLLVSNPILHPGVIAKAEVMKSLNYDTSLTCTEDLELWTRMAKNGYKTAILPEYLLIYRLHDKQITSTTLEKQHKEVLTIQKKFYSELLKDMPKDMQDFYINGIYFREKPDVRNLYKFYKWVKSANKEKKLFKNDAIKYAFFGILAEYKRCGIRKADIIKTSALFGLCFSARELLRRKNSADRDGKKCILTAEKLGLRHTSGTKSFPGFEK